MIFLSSSIPATIPESLPVVLRSVFFSRHAFPGELLQPQGDVAAVEAGDRDQWPPGIKEPGAGAFFETEEPITDCPAGFYILRAAFFELF
jgi:hypothetical protein